jgi:hypothetical protein
MMKRLAIIFIPIIFAFHFPVIPQNLLPRGWVTEIEDGKRWAQLFISFYRSETAESSPRKESPEAEPDRNIPQPLVFREAMLADALQPATGDVRQIQIEQSVEKCELSIRKMEQQMEQGKMMRKLEQLKTIRFPQRFLFERIKVIRTRAIPRPA